MKRTAIILLTIAVALIAGTASLDGKVKGKHRQSTKAAQTVKLPANINELMKFADKYSNRGSRFVHLADCPTSNAYIKTVVREKDFSLDVKIYINKTYVQYFKLQLPLLPDEIEIHYLDANFDGYTDVFVGKDEIYTGSGVYLWNPEIKRFEKADFRFIDEFILDPINKLCFFFYNDMMSDNFYKYCWEDRKMKCLEFVIYDYDDNEKEYIVGTGDAYGDFYNEKARNINYKTTDKNKLPQWWKDFINNWRLEYK